MLFIGSADMNMYSPSKKGNNKVLRVDISSVGNLDGEMAELLSKVVRSVELELVFGDDELLIEDYSVQSMKSQQMESDITSQPSLVDEDDDDEEWTAAKPRWGFTRSVSFAPNSNSSATAFVHPNTQISVLFKELYPSSLYQALARVFEDPDVLN